MRIACWIPKATNTHTICDILIALPLQQLSHERASILRYTYTACLIVTDAKNVYCAVQTGLQSSSKQLRQLAENRTVISYIS
jgi:hypothetical protein